MSRPSELWTSMRCGVAACLLDGMSHKAAAGALGVSAKSVGRHAAMLQRLLHAPNHAVLVAMLALIAADDRPLIGGAA